MQPDGTYTREEGGQGTASQEALYTYFSQRKVHLREELSPAPDPVPPPEPKPEPVALPTVPQPKQPLEEKPKSLFQRLRAKLR